MATKFKCNDPIYTILRNGKVLASSTRPSTAVEAIIDDANRNVCAPDCCITGADITADTFAILVTSANSAGMYVRVTIKSGVDTYSTGWQISTGSDTIAVEGIVVDVGGWFDGDTVCIEYSYDQVTVIESCCATVFTSQYDEDATYDLTDDVPGCTTSGALSTFELLYQNPDGGVTISTAGELVIPSLEETETVFAVRRCDGCTQEILVLTATALVPELALRLTFDNIANVPVASASSVSDWNTFFLLPMFGTPFTSVGVAGNEVSLYGGAGITVKANAFTTNTNLLYVEDDAGCLSTMQKNAFSAASSLITLDIPSVTSMGDRAIEGCTALITLNTPLLTTLGDNVFDGCTSKTSYNIPSLTAAGKGCFVSNTSATTFAFPNLVNFGDSFFEGCSAITNIDLSGAALIGTTSGDDSVFNSISGATVTITVPVALATIDGGNPDGDLVTLAANNTATINYI